MKKHIAIIGAGPIGLEAALAARQAGFASTVFEAGCVADSVRRWGRIRMFSPFSMNASETGQVLLRRDNIPLPPAEAYITGAEYAESYLIPLAARLEVLTHTRVKSVVRESAGKKDQIGEPGRLDTPFRLTVENRGVERHVFAGIVLDCSGTFLNPNPLGDGGVEALGELAARLSIRYGVGETGDPEAMAGSRVLIVGGGHSAANLIHSLVEVKERNPLTQIHWVVKRRGWAPCALVADDPLSERARVCKAANAAAANGIVTLHDSCTVYSAMKTEMGMEVTLRSRGGTQVLAVDHVIAATGFRPDWSMVRELHLQTCWATEGTYPLAASLLGEAGGDCLAVAVHEADTLRHPEPDFYALGTKSYGRTPDFLIQTGLQQIQSLMRVL